MGERVRVLVVDDHPVVRDGLRGQLSAEADIEVVAEAASGEEALALLERHIVHVLLTDLRMPGLGGPGLIRAVRAGHPDVEVLVLTTYDTDDDVREAMEAGARGYLLKDAPRQAVSGAVRSAAAGHGAFAPSVQHRLAAPPDPPVLSARELEVLRLVAAGHTNQQIGRELFIGEATVKTHLQHVFGKLGVADRASAVAAGYQRSLL